MDKTKSPSENLHLLVNNLLFLMFKTVFPWLRYPQFRDVRANKVCQLPAFVYSEDFDETLTPLPTNPYVATNPCDKNTPTTWIQSYFCQTCIAPEYEGFVGYQTDAKKFLRARTDMSINKLLLQLILWLEQLVEYEFKDAVSDEHLEAALQFQDYIDWLRVKSISFVKHKRNMNLIFCDGFIMEGKTAFVENNLCKRYPTYLYARERSDIWRLNFPNGGCILTRYPQSCAVMQICNLYCNIVAASEHTKWEGLVVDRSPFSAAVFERLYVLPYFAAAWLDQLSFRTIKFYVFSGGCRDYEWPLTGFTRKAESFIYKDQETYLKAARAYYTNFVMLHRDGAFRPLLIPTPKFFVKDLDEQFDEKLEETSFFSASSVVRKDGSWNVISGDTVFPGCRQDYQDYVFFRACALKSLHKGTEADFVGIDFDLFNKGTAE